MKLQALKPTALEVNLVLLCLLMVAFFWIHGNVWAAVPRLFEYLTSQSLSYWLQWEIIQAFKPT